MGKECSTNWQRIIPLLTKPASLGPPRSRLETRKQALTRKTGTLTWTRWGLQNIGPLQWLASILELIVTKVSLLVAQTLLWRSSTKCIGASNPVFALRQTLWSEESHPYARSTPLACQERKKTCHGGKV